MGHSGEIKFEATLVNKHLIHPRAKSFVVCTGPENHKGNLFRGHCADGAPLGLLFLGIELSHPAEIGVNGVQTLLVLCEDLIVQVSDGFCAQAKRETGFNLGMVQFKTFPWVMRLMPLTPLILSWRRLHALC